MDLGPGEVTGRTSASTASASPPLSWSSRTSYSQPEKTLTPHEQRWRTTGLVGPSVTIVVHTWPQGSAGRIISARMANRTEKRRYEETNG